ncbi:MAG: hypothetical protein HYX74_07335 [Acidobacteria bacterium]|nr:hypothetical protein [Acidobacteriota bacterium]
MIRNGDKKQSGKRISRRKEKVQVHKFTIADDEAVHVLVEKLLDGGSRQRRREKLLKALKLAARSYNSTNQRERQAFFHGLLTGYAVALQLW